MTAEKGRKLKKRFVDEMQTRILSGQLKPGDRLPPERELAEELGCAYLDCNAPLLDGEGFLKKEYMTDPIHFSPAGYVEVLKILEPYL